VHDGGELSLLGGDDGPSPSLYTILRVAQDPGFSLGNFGFVL
jgi:hypothetical protein